MLGMGSGWWAVAGLISDVIGFSLLAWDLLPEYRLNRLGVALADVRTIIAEHEEKEREISIRLAAHRGEDDAEANAAVDHAINMLDLEATVIDVDVPALKKLLSRALTKEQLSGIFVKGGAKEYASPNGLRDVIVSLGKEFDEIKYRTRPSLYLAITLIVLGFALQAWGSIPLTAEGFPAWPLSNAQPPEVLAQPPDT